MVASEKVKDAIESDVPQSHGAERAATCSIFHDSFALNRRASRCGERCEPARRGYSATVSFGPLQVGEHRFRDEAEQFQADPGIAFA